MIMARKAKETKMERLERYHREGRGDWWFAPLWKQILWVFMLPFVYLWFGLCWCIMMLGRGIYMFGDFASGWRWNGGDWSEDV